MTSSDPKLNYSEVIKILESNPENVYQELMEREAKVLQAVNVISEIEEKKINMSLSDIPIKDIYFKFVRSMKQIFFEDLFLVKTPNEIPPIFLDGSRKIYTGILVVVISLILFFALLTT
jgi:hypothetical protein